MICKYCKRKGTHRFGWLDVDGSWHDKHLTCHKHAPISVAQQSLRVSLAQIKTRPIRFYPTDLFLP